MKGKNNDIVKNIHSVRNYRRSLLKIFKVQNF